MSSLFYSLRLAIWIGDITACHYDSHDMFSDMGGSDIIYFAKYPLVIRVVSLATCSVELYIY